MDNQQYHISVRGHLCGPLSLEEVRQKLSAGEVSLDDMGWRPGLPEWLPLGTLLPFLSASGPPPLPRGVPPAFPMLPAQPPTRKKSLTWLWVTLGCGAVLIFAGLLIGSYFLIRTVEGWGSDTMARRPMLEERASHQPQWRKSDYEPAGPADVPDGKVFELIRYRSENRDLAAYLTPDPKDGKKHPAIVWAHGGFGGIGSYFWDAASKRNDQSARAFRERGIVMMCPSWRGENDNAGRFELFYGEVEDLLWAVQHVKKLPYVDPERVYIGGHSTGGTLTLLAAASSNQFRAAFSFGGMLDGLATLGDGEGYGNTPYDPASQIDHRLRSPMRYSRFIRLPTFYFEGGEYYDGFSAGYMAGQSRGRFQNYHLPGDHFDILHPVTNLIADKILNDTGADCNIRFTAEELKRSYEKAFSHTLAMELEAWSREGGSLAERLEKAEESDILPHVEADLVAMIKIVKQAQSFTPETTATVAAVGGLRSQIEDEDLLTSYDKKVAPVLAAWAQQRLDQGADLGEQEVETFFELLSAVASAHSPEGAELVIAATQNRKLPESEDWSLVFGAFDGEHPHTDKLMNAFATHLPQKLTGALLLEAANDLHLDSWKGTHPFDSAAGVAQMKEWLLEADPAHVGNAHSTALGAAFLKNQGRKELIALALKHADYGVRMEGAWSDVKAGDGTQGRALLREACLLVHQSARAQDYLKELGREGDIPPQALEPAFAAQASFSRWLQHPSELGAEPVSMEIYDHQKLRWPPTKDQRDLWLIKFTHKDGDSIKTSYGCAGSMPWSSFEDYAEAPSPAELYVHHCTLEMQQGQVRTESTAKKEDARALALEALRKGNPGLFDSIDAPSR